MSVLVEVMIGISMYHSAFDSVASQLKQKDLNLKLIELGLVLGGLSFDAAMLSNCL